MELHFFFQNHYYPLALEINCSTMFPNAAKISLILVPLQSLEILMFHVSETNDSESDSEMPLEDEKRTGTKHFLKNLL